MVICAFGYKRIGVLAVDMREFSNNLHLQEEALDLAES
jgi:hypothetical protein